MGESYLNPDALVNSSENFGGRLITDRGCIRIGLSFTTSGI